MANYGGDRWKSELNEDSEYFNDSSNKRKSARVQRACHNCRKRKQGCEDERPCKRCVEKGIPCEEVQMKKRGRAKIKKNTLPRTKDEDHDHYYHDHAHEDIGEEEELLVPQESPSDPSSDEDGPVTSQHSHEILQHSLDLSNQEDTETLEDAPEIESPRRNSFGPILPFLINVITHNDKKLLGHDLGCDSRYTDDPSNDSGDESPAEDECELFEEIKCWWELNRSQLQVNQKMQGDLTQVKDLWQDVLRDLRNMQWHRVKANLQKLSESEGNQVMGLSPAMIVWSAGGLIHHVNDAFCALSGYSMQELEVSIDGNSRMLASSLFDDVSIWKNQLEVAGHSHRSAYHLKTRIVSKDCREIPVTLSVTNLRDSLGFSLLTIAHLVPNLAATSRHWSGTILHHQQGLGVSMFA